VRGWVERSWAWLKWWFSGKPSLGRTSELTLALWQVKLFGICWALNTVAFVCCVIAVTSNGISEDSMLTVPLSAVLLGTLAVIAIRSSLAFCNNRTLASGLKALSCDPFTHMLFVFIALIWVYSNGVRWVMIGAIPYFLAWLLLIAVLNPWANPESEIVQGRNEKNGTLIAWYVSLMSPVILAWPAVKYLVSPLGENTNYSSPWGYSFLLVWVIVMLAGLYLRKKLWPEVMISEWGGGARKSPPDSRSNAAENGGTADAS
jgi:hypothetical protein